MKKKSLIATVTLMLVMVFSLTLGMGVSVMNEEVQAASSVKTTTVSTANAKTGVKVSWKKVSGATGYKIYRKVSGGKWKLVKTIKKGSTKSWTDTSVKSGKTYYYKIKTVKNSKTSSYSKSKKIKYLAAPTVTVSNTSSDKIKVSWDKVSGAKKYKVYRKTSSGDWTLVKTTTKTSYTDSNVTLSAGTYSYKVKAVNGSTKSAASSTKKKALVNYAGTVTVSNYTGGSVGATVKWEAQSGSGSTTVIYRKVSGGSWKKLATVSKGTYKYIDKTIESGKTYYYKVRNYRNGYYSAYTSAVKFKYTEDEEESTSSSDSTTETDSSSTTYYTVTVNASIDNGTLLIGSNSGTYSQSATKTIKIKENTDGITTCICFEMDKGYVADEVYINGIEYVSVDGQMYDGYVSIDVDDTIIEDAIYNIAITSKSISNWREEQIEEFYELLNQYRVEAGVDELEYREDLQSAADTRAEELATSFSHTRPDDSDYSTVFNELGLEIGTDYWTCGENCCNGARTASIAITWLSQSSGHKANMLSNAYSSVVVSLYIDEDTGARYWEQLFIG